MPAAGFGIEAAARQQALDFIPLATERYFLALRRAAVATAAAQALLEALRSPEFRECCRKLPGYDAAGSGENSERERLPDGIRTRQPEGPLEHRIAPDLRHASYRIVVVVRYTGKTSHACLSQQRATG